MQPRLFEAIVFLKENVEWWDENLVQEMVAGVWSQKLSVYDYTITEYDHEGDDEW